MSLGKTQRWSKISAAISPTLELITIQQHIKHDPNHWKPRVRFQIQLPEARVALEDGVVLSLPGVQNVTIRLRIRCWR